MGKWTRRIAIGLPVLFLLIQAVPYGRDHDNPPVVREPPWADVETRVLAKRACFDCHSNETVWPAYSDIAPLSWLVQSDVTEGRDELNFSDWKGGARKKENPKKIREAIEKGEMPPFYYTLFHPMAKLGAEERKRLVEGTGAHRDGAQETVKVYSVEKKGFVTVGKVVRTDAEWRKTLEFEQYVVTREKGTEEPFSGQYVDTRDKGVYRCVCCGNDLFLSDTKYDSGTGWPSFFAPVAEENIRREPVGAPAAIRPEVLCRRCDAHLGHVFPDGPKPTGLRYCINSAALVFIRIEWK